MKRNPSVIASDTVETITPTSTRPSTAASTLSSFESNIVIADSFAAFAANCCYPSING